MINMFYFSFLQVLKEQYLGYRKMFLGDAVDVFEARRAEAKKWQNAPRVTTGPTPFSNMPNAAAVAMAATLTQQQQPATGLNAFKLQLLTVKVQNTDVHFYESSFCVSTDEISE